MKKLLTIIFLFFIGCLTAQNWKLELTSNVYLRTWKLNTKATEEEKEIGGATIKLYQNGKEIDQTTSNNYGEFSIMVPPNGEFYLIVSYPGCNAKRMAVNTQNVPEGIFDDKHKPSFKITGGFIMVKPYPGINYSELSQDLIRVEYFSNKKAFDDNPKATERGLSIVSKIYTAEDILFKEFCSTNKSGDVALMKPDCPLARQLYQKSIALIPGEQYPVEQLAKVGDCLKEIEERKKKAEEEAKAKEAEAAAAKAKAEEAAKAKEAEAAAAKVKAEEDAKAKAEAAVKAKEEADKLAAQKKAEKEEADKLAAQKKAEKAEADKIAKEKADADKQAEAKRLAEQKNQDKLAKEKADAEAKEKAKNDKAEAAKAAEEKKLAKKKADEEKAAKQKEGLARSKAEDEAAMKAEYDEKMAKRKAKEEEDERKRLEYETEHGEHDAEMDKKNSKHKIPQVLGKDMYKENIVKADNYFKTKRYKEAKESYQEALKIKINDPYATKKIDECSKLLEGK